MAAGKESVNASVLLSRLSANRLQGVPGVSCNRSRYAEHCFPKNMLPCIVYKQKDKQ